MALSPQEQEILKYGQQNGKSRQDIAKAIGQFRYEQKIRDVAPQSPGPLGSDGIIGRAARGITDFLGGKAVRETYGAEIAKRRATADEKPYIEQPSAKETAGSALMLGSSFVGGGGAGANILKALAKGGVGAQARKEILKAAGYGGLGGYLYDIGQNLEHGKEGAETLAPGIGALAGSVTGPLGGAANAGARTTRDAIKAAAREGKVMTNSPVVRGMLQIGTEFSERVPRFVSKRRADIRDASTRAKRIATSPAPVGQALKAGVDERLVNTIEQADAPTRTGYKDIIDLAEESIDTSGTLKSSARPEIVAGEAAAKQYQLVEDQRKKVGKAIGDAVNNLSRDVEVPMKESYSELDQALQALGVGVDYGDTGVTLDFAKTGFTKAQRSKINELYQLATEGGDTLTPKQIHEKDRIFSQLQREARMENIGDIIVDAGEGPVSLFRIFRDVYSDALEQVAPEIKPLNKQYRNLVTFLDDVERSIVKRGKYETNASIDPAEFAQTNLRRLFSEAQSAADYRAIADEMDAASRALGYQGASPADLAQFAYEIRKIYPETTPRTGFEGSIKASIGGVVDAVLQAGKPDRSDQQKALRALIDMYSQ